MIFILLGISMLVSNNFKNVGSGIFFILFGTFFLLVKWNVLHQVGRLYLASGHHRRGSLDPSSVRPWARVKKNSLKRPETT